MISDNTFTILLKKFDQISADNINDRLYNIDQMSRRALALFCKYVLCLSYSDTANIMLISKKGVWMHCTSNAKMSLDCCNCFKRNELFSLCMEGEI